MSLCRRKQRSTAIVITAILLLFIFQHHIIPAIYLIEAPFRSLRYLSSDDDFDITFASYEREQPDLDVVYTIDGQQHNQTSKVPPIIHYILLAPATLRPQWAESQEACRNFHPKYEFMVWDDDRAEKFVRDEYPDYFEMWKNYKYPIQRADSLRYFIVLKYGGIFLDLDLKCLRSLEPIRRLSFLAPAANPQGISNGFFAATPNHPLLKSAVEHLPSFNVNWIWSPYATVMASTGCQYFSTILAAFEMGENDRVLTGPVEELHMHRLSGEARTPLFFHFGSSSWHGFDAKWVNGFTAIWLRGRNKPNGRI